MSDGTTRECPKCHGHGEMKCATCDDDGVLLCECMCGDQHDVTCHDCEGIFAPKCDNCDGSGRIPTTEAMLEHEGQINFLEEARHV